MTDKDELLAFVTAKLRAGIHNTGFLKRSAILADYRLEHPRSTSDEPAIAFEELEPTLKKGLFSDGLRILYDPISDRVTAERVPTPDLAFRLQELGSQALEHNLRDLMGQLDGFKFQKAVTEIFRLLPWVREVSSTRLSRDGGVDLELVYKHEGLSDFIAVGQVKRTQQKTGASEIRDFIGALGTHKPRPDLGVFVSWSGYSKDAIDTVKKSPIRIQTHDCADLLGWLRMHSIGVRKEAVEMEFVDDVFWNESVSK